MGTRQNTSIIFVIVFVGMFVGTAFSEKVDVNTFLSDAKYDEGIKYYSGRLEKQVTSEDVFSLAALQFIDGIGGLCQDLYDYGQVQGQSDFGMMFLQMPVPKNPNPKKVTYDDVRNMLIKFQGSMQTVNATLDKLPEEEFKVRIRLGEVRIDYDGDGTATDEEMFYKAFKVFDYRIERMLNETLEFPIAFDTGDAYWLKGYSHLLMAMCDLILAHDWDKVFEYTGHAFFYKADTPYSEMYSYPHPPKYWEFMDAIAFIHLMHLPVIEPRRYKSARQHLKEVIKCSRTSWKYINAEEDNDCEWVPNDRQQSVTGTKINGEMQKAWVVFLDELEQILDGKKLVKHPQIYDGRGINVKKVFEEPQPVFDLVFWFQGTAATPYLETGPMSEPETWRMIASMFRGNLIGFAIWIN